METGELYTSETATMIALIVILCIFALLGSVGNGLSTFVFYKIRDKTSAQIFILSLSLIDLFTCTIIIPFTITMEYMKFYIKYDSICKLYMFLITSKVPLSAFMMVAIALDRYFCICHSLKRIVTPFRTKVVVGCLIAFACALGIATSLGYGVYYNYTRTEQPPGFNFTANDEETLRQLAEDTRGHVGSDRILEILQLNLTNMSLPTGSLTKKTTVIYTGVCRPHLHGFYLGENYVMTYQMIYSSLFVVCFLVVGVLYSLIYRFIKTRRSKKLKRKLDMCTYTHDQGINGTKTMLLPSVSNVHANDAIQMVHIYKEHDPANDNDVRVDNLNTHTKKHKHKEEADKLRDEARTANIKTAAMLFIVTVVYILAFTPSWLMAHQIVPKQKVVFYLYFSYNVANPFIYAFLNQTFKNHLKKMFRCRR